MFGRKPGIWRRLESEWDRFRSRHLGLALAIEAWCADRDADRRYDLIHARFDGDDAPIPGLIHLEMRAGGRKAEQCLTPEFVEDLSPGLIVAVIRHELDEMAKGIEGGEPHPTEGADR